MGVRYPRRVTFHDGVLILSGGYGLVLPDESIGMYDCEFRPKMWPDRLVERCLAAFAKETGTRQVVGALSATTSYAKVFRRTEWTDSIEGVYLLTPESVGGAMGKAPRAQGEALAVIAETGLLGRLGEHRRPGDGDRAP